jgi:hypothetical protein
MSRKNGGSSMVLVEILIIVVSLIVVADALIRFLFSQHYSTEREKRSATKCHCQTAIKIDLMRYRTTKGHWPRNKNDLDAAGFSYAEEWTNPWKLANGYTFEEGPNDTIQIVAKYGNNADIIDYATANDTNGCAYILEPSGKLTEKPYGDS